MKRLFLFLVCITSFLSTYSQAIKTQSDTLRKDALKVFMEASDYVRKEIPYVNYVRDIKDAGVYIISTTQQTGSGGYERTYYIVGQNENAGMRDTLSFSTTPDGTEDESRIMEVRTLKMGLMRYVAKTPLSKYMKISFSEPLSETVISDKWNSWVYRTSVSGYLQGQKSYQSSSLYGNISASRVTKDWKINLDAVYNYSISKYHTGSDIVIRETNSKYINSLIVKSISDHWSYGGTFYLGASKFSNFDATLRIMPGIEYDLFPYSESTRRQLRLLYSAGYNYNNYGDTTIYNKMKEGLYKHSFSVAYQVVQKWGSINVSTQFSNYLHDWSKNNLSFNGELNLRIAKGLTVSIYGYVAAVHDQIGLVMGEATTQEILLQVKELETKFEYSTSFGLTYTFGSIYNNVVNPRFGN